MFYTRKYRGGVEILAPKLSGRKETLRDLKIPKEIDGKKVVSIGERAFNKRGINRHLKERENFNLSEFDRLQNGGIDIDIESLQLPDTLKEIKKEAFTGNKIEELHIPGSVRDICKLSFATNKIKKLTIEEGVENIWIGAFRYNEIETINLPDTIRHISMNAFAFNKLKGVWLPEGVSQVNKSFGFNVGIESLVLPKSMCGVELSAFERMRLENLVLPETLLFVSEGAFKKAEIENLFVRGMIESGIKQMLESKPNIKNIFYTEKTPNRTVRRLSQISGASLRYIESTKIDPYIKKREKMKRVFV